LAEQGAFNLCVSDPILAEVTNVLLNRKPLRRRFSYLDKDVAEYCRELMRFATVTSNVPNVSGVVIRDPNDDMIVACALAAGAEYIVTRDKDLLSIGRHQDIAMVTPEAFLQLLRAEE
jgi:putative PIN family toxin of toxin-antitoxin system